MNYLLKRLLTKWVLKNYPFAITTEVYKVTTVFVKKGKIREWRSYDEYHNRIPVVL